MIRSALQIEETEGLRQTRRREDESVSRRLPNRHRLLPTEQALLEYTAGSQGPIQEFVDVLAQFGTVRVPIVGWVDAPQGGPCSPSTVTES